MSGVFLIVQETARKPHESVLRATKGGYPHITLVYSSNKISADDLMMIGQAAYRDWLGTSVTGTLPTLQLEAKHAVVHSFPEERNGITRERHDVLLRLSPKDAATVSRLRSLYVTNKHLKFLYPHVTHSVHYDKAAAEAALAALQDAFPIEVQVVGYVID